MCWFSLDRAPRRTLPGRPGTTQSPAYDATIDATERFFTELGRRGHEPLVANFSGRVRIEIVDRHAVDCWTLTIERGDIEVTRDGEAPACIMRGDRRLFEQLVRGETNAMAATLREALECRGDVDLLLAVQRLFPGPQDDPR